MHLTTNTPAVAKTQVLKTIMATQRCILKTTLALVNLILFILGIVYVFLGTYVHHKKQEYLPDYQTNYYWEPLSILIIGAILATFSCLGCNAAAMESRLLMSIYITIMTALTISISSMSAVAYQSHNDVQREISGLLYDRIATYGLQNARHRHGFDSIQTDLQCCGINSYEDWVRSAYLEETQSVPDSCCVRKLEHCGQEMAAMPEHMATRTIFTNGCLPVLEKLMTQASQLATAIGILAGSVFLLTIMTTSFMACSKKPQIPSEKDAPTLLEL